MDNLKYNIEEFLFEIRLFDYEDKIYYFEDELDYLKKIRNEIKKEDLVEFEKIYKEVYDKYRFEISSKLKEERNIKINKLLNG